MEWVGIYGAVLATATAAWQTTREIRDCRARVTVDAGCTIYVASESDALKLQNVYTRNEWDSDLQWRIDLSVTNSGRSRVHITGISLEQGDANGILRLWTSGRWGLPWRLESDEMRHLVITEDDAPNLELAPNGVVASVETSRGKDFASRSVGTAATALVATPGELMDEMLPNWRTKSFAVELNEMISESETDGSSAADAD